MKKTFAIFTLLLISMSLYWHHKRSDEGVLKMSDALKKKGPPAPGDQYKKSTQQKHNKRHEQKKTIRSASKPSTDRSPASFKKLKREDRTLMGDVHSQMQDLNYPLPIVNQINPHWREDLIDRLDEYTQGEQKFEIEVVEKLLIVKRGRGQYANKIKVKTQHPEWGHSAYTAMVDAQTGKIIKTWDRPIHEWVKHRRQMKGIEYDPAQLIKRD